MMLYVTLNVDECQTENPLTPSPFCMQVHTQTHTHLVQRFLQNRFCIIKATLGHVTGCLAVQQQRRAGVLVSHLLEDVVCVLMLLSTLKDFKPDGCNTGGLNRNMLIMFYR